MTSRGFEKERLTTDHPREDGFLSSKDPYTNMAKDKKVIPDPIDDRKKKTEL